MIVLHLKGLTVIPWWVYSVCVWGWGVWVVGRSEERVARKNDIRRKDKNIKVKDFSLLNIHFHAEWSETISRKMNNSSFLKL